MQRIKIDFIINTIIVSRSFYEAAKEFGSEECQQMTNAKAAYPLLLEGLTLQTKERRAANGYIF